MNRIIIAGLLTVAAVPMALPALAAPKRASTPVADVDIAGIRLGMTPEQVRPALVRAGFTPRPSDPDQDAWDARVAAEVGKRRPGTRSTASKVPMFTMARGPRGEHLEIWYYAGPSGPIASSIKFQIPADQMTGAAFYQEDASAELHRDQRVRCAVHDRKEPGGGDRDRRVLDAEYLLEDALDEAGYGRGGTPALA
jgi:hypothetical protein